MEVFDLINQEIGNWYMHRNNRAKIGDNYYSWIYTKLHYTISFVLCCGACLMTKQVRAIWMSEFQVRRFVARDQDDFYVIVR